MSDDFEANIDRLIELEVLSSEAEAAEDSEWVGLCLLLAPSLARIYRSQKAEIERLNRIHEEMKELLIDLTKLKKRLVDDRA
jgi:hypothetical protein